MLRLALLCAGCFQVGLAFTCHHDSECDYNNRHGMCVAETCMWPDDDMAMGSGLDLRGVDFAGVDLSGAGDLAGADLAQPALPDLAGADLLIPACDYPQLLVTVENLDTPGPGKVLRYHIPPSGALVACAPLTGSGGLGQYPEAAAKVGDNIAVAARDGVFLVSPLSDVVIASWSNDGNVLFPRDVAPIQTGEGLQIAVAWEQNGSPGSLWQLDLFLPSDVTMARHSWLASALGLSNVTSMTIDPWDATKLMVLDEQVTPLAEEVVDPFAPSATAQMNEGNLTLHTIASISVGGIERTAWTATPGSYDGYYMMSNVAPSPKPAGPSYGIGQCGCHMLHAVPDPTDIKLAFALCDDPGLINGRTVQRAQWDSTFLVAHCTTIVDGMTLGARDRITHLAIAMP